PWGESREAPRGTPADPRTAWAPCPLQKTPRSFRTRSSLLPGRTAGPCRSRCACATDCGRRRGRRSRGVDHTGVEQTDPCELQAVSQEIVELVDARRGVAVGPPLPRESAYLGYTSALGRPEESHHLLLGGLPDLDL